MLHEKCTEHINTLCTACPSMHVESIDYDRTRSYCGRGHWIGNGLYNPVMPP